MSSHKHARLTYARRLEMVRQMTDQGLSADDAVLAHGVSHSTVSRVLARAHRAIQPPRHRQSARLSEIGC